MSRMSSAVWDERESCSDSEKGTDEHGADKIKIWGRKGLRERRAGRLKRRETGGYLAQIIVSERHWKVKERRIVKRGLETLADGGG